MTKTQPGVRLLAIITLSAITILYLWNRTYPEIARCFDDTLNLQTNSTSNSQHSNIAPQLTPPIISSVNVQALTALYSFDTPNNTVTAVSISSDNRLVGSGYINGIVKIVDLATEETITLSEKYGSVTSLAINPTNTILAVYDSNGTIALWNIANNEETAQWDKGTFSNTNNLLFTTEAALIYSQAKSVYRCDLASQENKKLFDNPAIAQISGIILDSTGENLLYSTNGDNDSTGKPEIGIWNLNSRNKTQAFNLHSTQITGISLSSNGQRLASVSRDGIINFIDLQTNSVLPSLSITNELFSNYSIALNSDGSLIVVGDQMGGENGNLSVWNADTGALVKYLDSQADSITALIFAPKGNLIISGSENGTVKVWGIPA